MQICCSKCLEDSGISRRLLVGCFASFRNEPGNDYTSVIIRTLPVSSKPCLVEALSPLSLHLISHSPCPQVSMTAGKGTKQNRICSAVRKMPTFMLTLNFHLSLIFQGDLLA